MSVPSARGWAYRVAWMVLPPADDVHMAEALGLSPTRSVDWAAGLDAVSSDRSGELVLVTPPVDGHRYAVGGVDTFSDLTDALVADDPARLLALAATLDGEAQLFASHPGSDFYVWARADATGHRYLAINPDHGIGVGGTATDVEQALGVDLITGDTEDDLDLVEDLIDETTVMAVAAAWGTDPSSFEDDDTDCGPALLGRRSRPDPSAALPG